MEQEVLHPNIAADCYQGAFIEPTPTLTPIPLSALKLDQILIQSGDLPAGLSGAQIRDTAPAMFKDVPMADSTIYQQLARNGNSASGVAVFLYEDKSKVDKAYSKILGGMGQTPSQFLNSVTRRQSRF